MLTKQKLKLPLCPSVYQGMLPRVFWIPLIVFSHMWSTPDRSSIIERRSPWSNVENLDRRSPSISDHILNLDHPKYSRSWYLDNRSSSLKSRLVSWCSISILCRLAANRSFSTIGRRFRSINPSVTSNFLKSLHHRRDTLEDDLSTQYYYIILQSCKNILSRKTCDFIAYLIDTRYWSTATIRIYSILLDRTTAVKLNYWNKLMHIRQQKGQTYSLTKRIH